MAYKMSTIQNKGGTGKSSWAVNTAVYLIVNHGLKVRLKDLDPQSDASAMCRFEVEEEEGCDTIYEAIERAYRGRRLVTGTMADVIQPCRWDVPWRDKFSFVPSRFDLEDVHQGPPSTDALLRVRAASEGVDDDVDVVIYDCPPSLGMLPQMAWADSDDVVFVTQPSFRSYRGLCRTEAQLYYSRKDLKVPDLDYAGYVINGQRNTDNHRKWVPRIKKRFGPDRYWGTIPLRTKIGELDDELTPIAMMPENTAKSRAKKKELAELFEGPTKRLYELATSTVVVG